MSEKTLYLELFQPYAQYRNPFTFYYAQTYPLPPKSTIIGMLQYALKDWYGTNYGQDLWWNLKVSIHGGFENVFWNYQQLIKGYVEVDPFNLKVMNQQKPLYGSGIKSQRTPVYQQELFNGRLFIFIRGDKDLLKEIKNVFERPNTLISLGRSEDLIYTRNAGFLSSKGNKKIKKSLWILFPTYIKTRHENKHINLKTQKYPVYYVPVKSVFEDIIHKHQITKQTKRNVKFEVVMYVGFDYLLKFKDRKNSLRYEEFIIDNRKFRIIDGFGWL